MHTPEPKTFLFLGILLALALLSLFISSEGQGDKDDGWRKALSMAYYLEDAELRSTGPDGKEVFRILARNAAQEPDELGIKLTEVNMIYGPPTALPWDLKADRGYIPEDASVIELHENVVAVSASIDKPTTVIRTQRLDINPATREATTEARVKLDFDGRVINAKGMEANFETNDLKLLSNVSGKFLP